MLTMQRTANNKWPSVLRVMSRKIYADMESKATQGVIGAERICGNAN